MLSVRPVQGPLYAYRACTGYFTSTIPYRCAGLVADSTCGYLGAGDVPVVISEVRFLWRTSTYNAKASEGNHCAI